MSHSSDLIKETGVIAAGLYSRKYLVRELEGPFSSDQGVRMATFCAAITQIMEMQGLLLNRMSGKPGWENPVGWILWGPEASVVTIGESMSVAKTHDASFNKLVSVMKKALDTVEVRQR
ncbi:MAG TPA: DUF2173 family protein [Burkholderiales bacterium]|nr:DUF2173 family protein [Burkholderiales bacterium]